MLPWHKNNPILSSFMTYHRVCNKSNTTVVASGAGTVSSFGEYRFISFVVGLVYRNLKFSVWTIVFPLDIVLSVLRFTVSDFPFGIVKLFLDQFDVVHGIAFVNDFIDF